MRTEGLNALDTHLHAGAIGYVFVLWGLGFDESSAAIFVTELRDAGVLVKVVGLTKRVVRGANGLALVPDWTLEHTLTVTAITNGVVIPCDNRGMKQLIDDPRVQDFFERADTDRALFIVSNTELIDRFGTKSDSERRARLCIYPEKEELVRYARQIAITLAHEV